MADAEARITGGLTRDVELRFTQGGLAMAVFTIAFSHRKKKDDAWEEESGFIDVTAFGTMAENAAASGTKGSRVTVVGRIQQQSWEDRESGQKRSKLCILADEIAFNVKWATVQVNKVERDKTNGGTQKSKKADPVYGEEEPF